MSRSYTKKGERRKSHPPDFHGMKTKEDKYAIIRENRLKNKRRRKLDKKIIEQELLELDEINDY